MPRLLRTATGLATALLLAIALDGCGLMGRPLESAAVDYYNYMAGVSPGRKYSSFLSPAYRKALPKKSLEAIDTFKAGGGKKNAHARELKKADVRSRTLGGFGVSAPVSQTAALAVGRETRWVKDGSGWFIFLGNDAELKKYGPFPIQLQLPPIERDDKSDPDRPQ